MKHLYKYIVLLLAVLLSTAAYAQSEGVVAPLRFDSEVYDYGHISETGGSVACRFVAVNGGERGVVISNVVTSCGCTSARYRRDTIAVGDTVSIAVSFDPLNRPGRIEKSLYVYTDGGEAYTRLRIIGNVTPRERSVEEIYSFDMGGGLRLDSNFHAFSYVEHGRSIETRIGYVNNSDRRISLQLLFARSSGALAVDYPHYIEPHATGDIVLCYSLSLNSSRYGTMEDFMTAVVDGKPSETLITTHAIAVDNFNLVDDISSPRADISKNIIKFGSVKCDERVLEQSFTLRNGGVEPLVVRAVESGNDAVTCDLKAGTTIVAGGEVVVTVRLRTRDIDPDVPFVTRLRIITNDALKPMSQVRVNALPE